MKFTDDLAKVRTIIGEVTSILTAPELPRPLEDRETPQNGTVELRGVHFGYGETEVLHGVNLAFREGTVNALVGPSGSGKSSLPAMDISGEEIMPHRRALRAENIRFSYERRPIIDGVTLEIPEKSVTAIVGPSGGGKTTLCHLLSRFWDVDGGRVTLGGRDVRGYSMDNLMKNFSFVFQNVYLFHDTIANNIRFGQPDAPMEQVIAAAKKARCHDFIMKLPQGYETVVGEAGGSLSGGERQRLSIARAMMKDAPIIILDEATANVDPENEKELMEAVGELIREKTVILIAHRLKTVRNADQILVLDKGRIVQRGTHDELAAQDGVYRRFITGRERAVGWKL